MAVGQLGLERKLVHCIQFAPHEELPRGVKQINEPQSLKLSDSYEPNPWPRVNDIETLSPLFDGRYGLNVLLLRLTKPCEKPLLRKCIIPAV